MTPKRAMLYGRLAVSLLLLTCGVGVHAENKLPRVDKVLFNFEDDGAAAAWSNLSPSDPEPNEPPAKVQLSEENATSGKRSLRITFAGGTWPAVTTAAVTGDWNDFLTFRADVTVNRPCIVGFRALQEKSKRDESWEGVTSRWVKTEFCIAGRNSIVAALHPPNDYAVSRKFGRVTRFEVLMYEPHEGESIDVDNIRLTKEPPPAEAVRQFKVVGADLTVSSAVDLEKRLKDQWKPPVTRMLKQAEEDFHAQYEKLKVAHPRAALAILRTGQKGYDPVHPDKPYDGWTDARWSSHGPDGMLHDRAINQGHDAKHELFMRHRSPLMRTDLSFLPEGTKVLAAQIVIMRADLTYDPERNPEKNNNVWVAEPCNRPWKEYEVNAYRYAKDKPWKAVGGMSWDGDDPDFVPLYFLLGPGQGALNAWDCTDLVKYWTEGHHENHGFMLHSSPGDWMLAAWSREAPELMNRPAMMLIYE